MSKIDKLVSDVAVIKDHCGGCSKSQDAIAVLIKEHHARITSLEDTRTFQKGMLKLATILTISVPTFGAMFIKGWKFLQAHRFVP